MKMTKITERDTQNRVIKLFTEQMGYEYLGNLQGKRDNSNIEEVQLSKFLIKKYNQAQIKKAIYQLKQTANNYNANLYQNNKAVYELLRYGIDIKTDIAKPTEHIYFIDWKRPTANHFYIAEEVTITGKQEKRPDVVLYINGIAIGVLELKRSNISIIDGISQSLTNQQAINHFFTTIQFIFAGNNSEGLQYGTIGTGAKFFLKWKEDEQDNTDYKLDKYLQKICNKERFVDLLYDFVLFDGGQKKLPRAHQYFAVKAAQKHINNNKDGGIIWHAQGSGKSIVMVLLAKWILENYHKARVLIVTDRDELDKQIERVFTDSGEDIYRTSSGDDLMAKLSQPLPRLLCSLVHKFGKKGVDSFKQFIKQLANNPIPVKGDLFVFVDECHRTQSGKLHKTMKTVIPNATIIGFTGTPLLKKDKTSLEIFGKYIHTYKFNEAVADKVVLDLMYESRDIDQKLSSPKKVDEWFKTKTKGLNDYQQAELKKKWGTMQKVLSAKPRMDKVVADIVYDFSTKPILSSGGGNAILVASSIFEACRYYGLFQNNEFKNKCAVITSYNPYSRDITNENMGTNNETDKEFIYKTYADLLKNVTAQPNKSKTETYEDNIKKRFINEPDNIRLLIVVDKLLTGFDAPSCSYLYIDKSMQDHGLFQAICRTNRLNNDSKDFGYIVDYKDLFKKVENAMAVYTSDLEYDEFEASDCDILLKDRLEVEKSRLDDALEALEALCEGVEEPKTELEYTHYFCGNTEIKEDLKHKEIERMMLYKLTVAFVRAYSNISDSLEEAGYDNKEIEYIENRIQHYTWLREIIRHASGEIIDLKPYEADMRHLLDTYINAADSINTSPFGDMPLIDIIVKSGIADAIKSLPQSIQENERLTAETIENNIRSKILKKQLLDPAYFERMSVLLDEIIKNRKREALKYAEYLKKIAILARQVKDGKDDKTPKSINTPAKMSLYNNLGKDEELALKIDDSVMTNKQDNWRGNQPSENSIKRALLKILEDEGKVEDVFNIILQQEGY